MLAHLTTNPKSKLKLYALLAFLALLASCAPCRYVKPLAKKQSAASFSFGGPLIMFSGTPIPVPFTTIGYGYGLTDNVTTYGNVHTTSALFGNAQVDLGSTLNI